MEENNTIRNRIESQHSGDSEQLDAIFTDDERILIEAPAGYGKTQTVVSRIAYDFASERISAPKKILGLTFSINAAFKLRRDISERLPDYFSGSSMQYERYKSRLTVGNYHALSRAILEKYGRLLGADLAEINKMDAIDDSNPVNLTRDVGLSETDAMYLSNFSTLVKECRFDEILASVNEYNNKVLGKLVPLGKITYNAILSLTTKLFVENLEVKHFYHKLFTQIIVDEFQDTNLLSLELVRQMVGTSTRLVFLGDSLQRIYGFIGAVPNLLEQSREEFSLRKIELKQNYRFKNNSDMLLLDKNIRENARNPRSPDIARTSNLPFHGFSNQNQECDWIIQYIRKVFTKDEQSNCVILVQSRSANNQMICDKLEKEEVGYFYGLFSEESPEYINFHLVTLKAFNEIVRGVEFVNKTLLSAVIKTVSDSYSEVISPQIKSLLELLNVFLDRVRNEYSFLSDSEQIALIRETLINRTLKQNMEFLMTKVTITTVHGSKGLEWDHVILPDMEQYCFPNWPAMCGTCRFKSDCQLVIDNENENDYLNELSIFYVAVTRARKDIVTSASHYGLKSNGTSSSRNISCLLRIPGIQCA